jgi:cell wall-active antibiotic response 4TMS protein YvqF
MKCHYHPEIDGLSECRLCGHSLCASCAVEISGIPYCRECLQSRIEQPLSVPVSVPRGDVRSPKVAGWLSILPGLGLAYLGEYMKALTVALIFTGAIHATEHTEMGGFFIPLVWFGQLFYTIQEARRLNRENALEPAVTIPSTRSDKDSPLWGGILIGIGVLFLLDQFEMLHFGEIFERFWPVLIIVLGVQILLRGRRQGSRSVTS